MRKTNLFATLLLAAPLAASAASPLDGVTFQVSPFEVCKDATMISSKDFKKNESFWKEAIGECGIDVQVLPDTGFFNTMIGRLGGVEDSKRAIDFLQKVGSRTKAYIETNNELTENMRRCAMKDEAWFMEKSLNAKTEEEKNFYKFSNCDEVLGQIRKTVKELGPKVRVNLAAARSTRGAGQRMKDALKYITGSRLDIEAQNPSASEQKEADAIVKAESDAEMKRIKEELPKLVADMKAKAEAARAKGEVFDSTHTNAPVWFKEWYKESGMGNSPENEGAQWALDLGVIHGLTSKALEHLDEVSGALKQAPLLGFLKSDNPTDAELVAALDKVAANGKSNLAEVNDLLKDETVAGGKNRTKTRKLEGNDRVQHMLELMKYGPVVQEVLGQNPAGTCSVATGIANSIANTDLRNNMALMVGMLGTMGAAAVVGPAALGGAAVVSAAAPAMMATGVGLAFSAGIYTADYRNFAAAKRRTFGVVDTVNASVDGKKGVNVGDLKDFEAARDQLILSAAMSPADLIGTGIYLKTAGMAGATVGLLLKKPIERAALKAALRNKGMTDVAIEGLFKQVQSADPKIAAAAAKRLITETGADPAKVRFVRSAASKGLFLEQNPAAMKEVLGEVKNGRVYTRAMEIMENMNAAKINAGNRDQALKAAIAGAEFGVTDPKRLAAIITDWDEGLDGLAKTYEIAARKLEEPTIRGLASVEERQTAAFASALDELRAGNPELKAMPEKQWAEMRENMMTCPLKPAK